MKLNPEQALKLVSGKLPPLIMNEIKKLFTDEEWVKVTFSLPHEHLKSIMIEVIEENKKETMKEVTELLHDSQSKWHSESNQVLHTSTDTLKKDIISELTKFLSNHEFDIPENFGQHITEVLNGWLDARQAEATKAQTQAPPGQPAMVPQGQGEMVDVVIQAITQYNPLAGQLLAKARANNGGRPSRNSGSSNYNNRGY